MTKFVFCFLLLFVSLQGAAQQRAAAFEMNARLGRGINMGNAFEAPSETAWGNPWKPEYFRVMAEMGFQHVRVPINWETENRSLAVAPYTIQASFLARIIEVVDQALAQNLIIIINMHHHDLLYEDPLGQKNRFLAQWRQIALEEITTVITSVSNEPAPALLFFQNPVTSFLQLKNARGFQQAVLYDRQGRGLEKFELQEDDLRLNLEKYSQGLYFIRLTGSKVISQHFKILKL